MENLENIESSAIVDVLQNGLASHTRSHAEILARDYEIKNPEQVAEFIGENLFLLDLLEEIPSKIYQYFGSSQKLSLKISHEPDFPQSPELWIYVLTGLSAKEALPILGKFDEEWWLENMDRSAWKLNINLKFV